MFLFSNPLKQPDAAQADHPVARPLKAAAEATGISFDYLMRTAKRESNFNPSAKSSSSSATGLFQFIEQTWLGLVKKEGGQLGLKAESDAIQQDRSGRYSVPEASARQKILDLRKDPDVSAKVAAVFTQKNKDSLRGSLRREPKPAELYMAHFLGAGGAGELISLAENNPGGSAARSFPDAASANRSIFFDGKGRARTNREVYARLASFHSGGDALPVMTVAAASTGDNVMNAGTRSPLAMAAIRNVTTTGPAQRNTALHGLFRNGGDSASATALRNTWGSVAEARLNKDAPSFFPRNSASLSQSKGVQVASIAPDTVMQTTLNDAAPVSFSSFEAIAPAVAPPAQTRAGTAARSSAGKPLDLFKFLKPQSKS